MKDRQFEDQTFPKAFPLEQFSQPLIIAPHPDDEVFGCGGLIALWAAQGIKAQVVVLTSGEEQGEALRRQAESHAAAAILGHSVTFWDVPDREVRASPMLIQRLAELIDSSQCDVVFCPALHEPHPDHQATALAVLWSLAQSQRLVDVCFYESGDTLVHCTHLLDITSVVPLKNQAMDAFASQEGAQPYRSRINARDHFRAMTLGHGAAAAEGFQWVSLAGKGWSSLLPALDPLFLHARGQAVSPEDLPLVSVLIRTVGDPALEQAIASACAQTYPGIELIVVAAHGVAKPPAWLQTIKKLPVQWVCRGEKLTRPQAANAALATAQGKYCVFLDDDDLIAPGHIEKLVQLLRNTPMARAAHTDTQVINAAGKDILRYERPYSASRLTFTNVFPIHSVLFERSLVSQSNCRFDESLPVLEDWDFWLQVSELTDFPHVAGLSAIYRYRDRSQLLSDDQHPNHHRQWRQQVASKWLTRLPAQRLTDAAAWYAEKLDHQEQLVNYTKNELTQTDQARAEAVQQHLQAEQKLEQTSELLQQSRAYIEQAQTQHNQESEQLARTQYELQESQQMLNAIYGSRGWKLLQLFRRIKLKLTGGES